MNKKFTTFNLRDFTAETANKIYELEVFLTDKETKYINRLVFRGVSNYEIDNNFLIIYTNPNKIKYIKTESIEYFNVEVFCNEEWGREKSTTKI